MRIIFAGTPPVAATALTLLLESQHSIVGVMTQPDARTGRGRKLTPSAVAEVAEHHEIPVLKAESVRTPEAREWIRSLDADAAAVVAYGQLLSTEVLELLPYGWFNLHFSMLPKYRGAAPVQRALIDGCRESGVSVFRIDSGLDTGPIARTRTFTFGPTMTAGTALDEMARAGAPELVAVFDSLDAGNLALEPQVEDGATYAAKLRPAQARIMPNAPHSVVSGHIRGFSPQPGAFVEHGGVRVKVLGVGSALPPEGMQLAPGEWGVTKKNVFLGTATDPVCISQVAPAGKKVMNAADWARGIRMATGDTIDFPNTQEDER